MTPKAAGFGVVIGLLTIAVLLVFHHQFRPQLEEAHAVSKIEQLRRSDPLPPAPPADEDLMSNAKKVRTTSFKKPPPTSLADMNTEPVAKPLVNDDVHPIKVETLPSQVQPIQLKRPPPPHRRVQNDADDDEPKQRGSNGVCAKYGGHKVTFHRRSGWESWRCVYPHRHRND